VRPSRTANAGRKRYSVLGGYSPISQRQVSIRLEGRVNAETVCRFIDALEAAFAEAQSITVYVDNARYFHARLVKAYLIGKRVRFVYLPPYSPNLNLIERLWKLCKKKVLAIFYATFAEFTQVIDEFFDHLERYQRELATLMTENFELFTCR
jgi:transposase